MSESKNPLYVMGFSAAKVGLLITKHRALNTKNLDSCFRRNDGRGDYKRQYYIELRLD